MFKTYTIPSNRPDLCTNQVLWVTDIHEDSCTKEKLSEFIKILLQHEATSLLVGGDTSNGQKSIEFLQELKKKTKKTIYFVFGNHDFYGYGIEETRQKAVDICSQVPGFHYLSEGCVFALSESTALVGHDGWADGRVGDFLQSTISLGDYFLIKDLKGHEGPDLLHKLNALGDEAADKLGKTLVQALKKFSQVIILTHIPPFKEVCCYHGMVCDDNWGPHFVCEAMGKKILTIAKEYPKKEILVLCGHSHTHAEAQIASNVRSVAGEAVLGEPFIQASIWYQ